MRAITTLIGTFTLALAACRPPAPELRVQSAIICVESEPGAPVANATIVAGGNAITRTNATGRAALEVRGRDGDVFHFTVGCPEGTEPASALDFDVLVRRSLEDRAPEFTARCAPSSRRTVVAVRAAGGSNLPVVYLGREVARTDTSGAATVVLDLHPGDEVELLLDTREAPKLHPQNPILSFKAEKREDILVLDQKFTVDKPPVRRFVAQKPNVPRQLGGG